MEIKINGHTVVLLFQKALYFPASATLVVSDLHLGKVAHFRKEGIALPMAAQMDDYYRLGYLINTWQPRRVIFLGDLFHSSLNDDWRNFARLLSGHSSIEFILVRGNHDLIHEGLYKELDVHVTDALQENGILFTHEPMECIPPGFVNIYGHIHPGYTISGAGKQSFKLPCFYYRLNAFVVPAFGRLTGLYNMPSSADSDVYLVLSDEVRKI